MMEKYETVFSFEEIRRVVPQQFPMLLIDKIVKFEPMKHATGIKNITGNEHHMIGHFKDVAVNPGVYMLESLFQTALCLGVKSDELPKLIGAAQQDCMCLLTGIEKFQFKSQAVPGDQLILSVDMLSIRVMGKKIIGKFTGVAKVEDKVITRGRFTCMYLDAKSM